VVRCLQQHVPAEALSRVSCDDVRGSFALAPLGLAVVGPAASALGTRTTLITGAVVLTAVTLAALASPGVRRLRTPTS